MYTSPVFGSVMGKYGVCWALPMMTLHKAGDLAAAPTQAHCSGVKSVNGLRMLWLPAVGDFVGHHFGVQGTRFGEHEARGMVYDYGDTTFDHELLGVLRQSTPGAQRHLGQLAGGNLHSDHWASPL